MTRKDKNALVQSAIKVRQNSYAPYSKFKVGAALLTTSHKIFTGCNVENNSYGLTICAERNAICNAVADGETEFLAMAIVADTPEPVLPCGACRQVMAEFCPDLHLICANLKDQTAEYTLTGLLPNVFKL